MQKHLITLLLGLAAGFLGGAAGVYVQNYNHPPSPPIAVVDVKKLILDHQEEIAKTHPSKELTEAERQQIIQDARDFAASLSHALNQVGAGRTLLIKDAVIGDSADLTREVNDRMTLEIELAQRSMQGKVSANNKEIKTK